MKCQLCTSTDNVRALVNYNPIGTKPIFYQMLCDDCRPRVKGIQERNRIVGNAIRRLNTKRKNI